MTALGKLLAERGISARALGEAIAIAEDRERRILTGQVNLWIWHDRYPTTWRQRIIANLLQLPVDDIFPPRPSPKKPSAADQQLLAAAAELEEPDTRAGIRHLTKAIAQERLPAPADADAKGTPTIDYRALRRAA